MQELSPKWSKKKGDTKEEKKDRRYDADCSQKQIKLELSQVVQAQALRGQRKEKNKRRTG